MEGKFNSLELWNDVMQKKLSHLFRVNVHAIYNFNYNLKYSPNLSNIQLQLEQRTAESQRDERHQEPGTRTNQNH